MKRVVLILFLLFFLGIGIVGFWYYQERIFSKEILKLEILAPDKITLGEEIEYLVKYKNNGNVRLEEARLSFEYPKYSLVEEDSIRKEIDLEDIYPGQERTHFFKARIFGKEGEIKIAKAWLSYRPKNLQARFESVTLHTTQIDFVPLTFEFDLPSKIESGKEIRFRLNYFSNVDFPLPNLRIEIKYPSEFEFLESIPSALEKTGWEIGLLNKAEGGRIEVLGKIQGDLGETKIFQAKLGQWIKDEFVVLKEISWGVEIIKPLLYIIQEINGNPMYIANPGDFLGWQISFKNIGEKTLENLFLVVKLESKLLDFSTLKTEFGQFEEKENKIIWDYTMLSDLRRLTPMAEGKVKFWIKVKDDFSLDFKNPEIKTKISLDGFKEEFITKVNSKLEFFQKGYFEDEVFGNSGPLPPKIGEKTTYTIIWHAKNYYNDVKDVKVRAVLGKGVKLTGKIFPEEARLTFDSESREVIWEVGDLKLGQGILTPAPNIAFQVSFTPTLEQKGKISEIIGEAKIIGFDQWTEKIIEETASAIDTTLPDDKTVTREMGIVQ